jgi:homoserine O-succinyltransferase
MSTSLAENSRGPRPGRRPFPSQVERPLRVGVLGLSAESPASLIEPLSRAALPVHAISIHLGSTNCVIPDPEHACGAVSFTRAILDEPLDGLVLAGGAPDASVDIDAHPRFRELTEIVEYARGFVPSTLGLGNGGLLLAHALGLRVLPLDPAVRGLVPQRVLRRDHPLFRRGSEIFFAAESRSHRIDDESVDRAVADRRIIPLAYSHDAGVSIFESADGRCIAHLGRPEQKPARATENGRLSAFHDSARESARAHAAAFFEAWVARVYALGRKGRAAPPR